MARKWAPGHYVTLGRSVSRRGNYHKQVGNEPNLLALTNVEGVQVRFRWSELEKAAGEYDFGPVADYYDDDARSIRAELWRCALNDSRLIVMVEDKSFDGTNPMPAYMAGNPAYARPNASGGFTAVRYDSYVQARFRALLLALGNEFDAHPNWYAVAFQESALGINTTDRIATGYTDEGYRDALIANLKAASDSFPTSRVFWYSNFFPHPSQDFRLQEVADSVKTHNGGDHGIDMGGPDILPDSAQLNTRVYPRFGAPPVGSHGELKLFNSMQYDSYDHTHKTATPDARMPCDVWETGAHWTMDQMFRWARDNLHLDSVMWEFATKSPNTFYQHAIPVIANYPRTKKVSLTMNLWQQSLESLGSNDVP